MIRSDESRAPRGFVFASLLQFMSRFLILLGPVVFFELNWSTLVDTSICIRSFHRGELWLCMLLTFLIFSLRVFWCGHTCYGSTKYPSNYSCSGYVPRFRRITHFGKLCRIYITVVCTRLHELLLRLHSKLAKTSYFVKAGYSHHHDYLPIGISYWCRSLKSMRKVDLYGRFIIVHCPHAMAYLHFENMWILCW